MASAGTRVSRARGAPVLPEDPRPPSLAGGGTGLRIPGVAMIDLAEVPDEG